MDRKTCYLAPVFDQDLLKFGTKVHFIKRNRKGDIKKEGTGKIKLTLSEILYVEQDNVDPEIQDSIGIKAKDVYYGKDSLKIIESEI